MADETTTQTIRNFFTNEDPSNQTSQNTTGSYGIINGSVDSARINDGLSEQGTRLGKLGSSIPSPMARLFLFTAALNEVNHVESAHPGTGHFDATNPQKSPTQYDIIVGELLDMLEFIFKYGDDPDFHVKRWDLDSECTALERSRNNAHSNLASALRSAFDFASLMGHPIYIFKWGDDEKSEVIGGSSPISLVYTSANLKTVLSKKSLSFTGNAGNRLFADQAVPLHQRDEAFREYLYRLRLTDMIGVAPGNPLYHLSLYIQHSATNYDNVLDVMVTANPGAFHDVKKVQSQGADVTVAGVQLRMTDHTVYINPNTTGYLLKPTSDVYMRGDINKDLPLILTKYGVTGLTYAIGREWNPDSDKIDEVLPRDIYDRHLPGLGRNTKYPFLTVSDFFEDKVIEVSYQVNKSRFFTGCAKEISFLLPLKEVFFDYFNLSDLVDANGQYTDMLTVEHDEDHKKLTVQLHLPLVNGHTITLHKTYDTSYESRDKLDCYDGANTFDFSVFPFYRLEPDMVNNVSHNVYNVMIGATVDDVSMTFHEPRNAVGSDEVTKKDMLRTPRQGNSLSTTHIRVNGAFTYIKLTVGEVSALVLPIFKKVSNNPAMAVSEYTFSIDFGTTNTHVSYVKTKQGDPFGHADVKTFAYDESDTQMVMFNNNEGTREFGAFATAVKRELVPQAIGANEAVKFPMRTATYQVVGTPITLEMFFNTNIGFNYGEDISRSSDYKTNIKWDRFDILANDRIKTFFAQMLWMMKNKSVLNDCTDTFNLVVTYPLSMRPNDFQDFKQAWNDAINNVQCNVTVRYRTESVAPYYSYLTQLNYGTAYANMDIGGGTTDILYINPVTNEKRSFSAFFAANDLWNDGLDKVSQAAKANGFKMYYYEIRKDDLGNRRAEVDNVIQAARSSADIVSYLFANDSWSRFSDTLKGSPKMMQLLAIHFSALTFYVAYSLHMAEVDAPKNLSFTGMGSKYINLLSSAVTDISRLINAIFHYAGKVLNNSKLQQADIKVSFAPNPKEVTATGALLSLNYAGAINPDEDTFLGYEDEDPGKTFRYKNITADVQDSVIRLFGKFTDMFKDETVSDALSDMDCGVDADVQQKLRTYAVPSFTKMKDNSLQGAGPNVKLTEPMFFWPLKDALYVIGKELAQQAIEEHTKHNNQA